MKEPNRCPKDSHWRFSLKSEYFFVICFMTVTALSPIVPSVSLRFHSLLYEHQFC